MCLSNIHAGMFNIHFLQMALNSLCFIANNYFHPKTRNHLCSVDFITWKLKHLKLKHLITTGLQTFC